MLWLLTPRRPRIACSTAAPDPSRWRSGLSSAAAGSRQPAVYTGDHRVRYLCWNHLQAQLETLKHKEDSFIQILLEVTLWHYPGSLFEVPLGWNVRAADGGWPHSPLATYLPSLNVPPSSKKATSRCLLGHFFSAKLCSIAKQESRTSVSLNAGRRIPHPPPFWATSLPGGREARPSLRLTSDAVLG